VQAGKSCATVESGKWVGPAKSAASGELVAVNDALVATPSLANDDPYGSGWMVVLKPEGWAQVKAGLATGADIAPRYEAKMDADGFAGCAPGGGAAKA
jgi:glycine cleavage system H protein